MDYNDMDVKCLGHGVMYIKSLGHGVMYIKSLSHGVMYVKRLGFGDMYLKFLGQGVINIKLLGQAVTDVKYLGPSIMGHGSWGCLVSQSPGSIPLRRGGWKTNTVLIQETVYHKIEKSCSVKKFKIF